MVFFLALCACVRCICGFCKCKYSESKTGSLKISPKNLKSNYQTEFYKKNFQNLVSPLTNHIYSTHDKEIPRIGLDYRTRHKLDFKNLEGASTGGNRRRKKNSYIKNSDPFLSLSAYQVWDSLEEENKGKIYIEIKRKLNRGGGIKPFNIIFKFLE